MYDILADDYRISYKRVMSGYAIYFEGKIFSIFAFGEIYFRQNEDNKKDFDEYKCKYFQYSRKDGKVIQMRYRILPEEVMEDRELLWDWIYKAIKT